MDLSVIENEELRELLGKSERFNKLSQRKQEEHVKRIAVTSLLVFLYKNEKWLKVENVELYNFAVWVVQSSPTVKEQTVEAIEVFLKKYVVEL